MRTITLSLILIASVGLTAYAQVQSAPSNPILAVVYNHYLETPRSKWEQKTHADINGTSCAATRWTDVDVQPSSKQYTLSYHITVDIDDLRDACLEGSVPEIDIKFDLTFDQTEDSKSINFKGAVPPDCKNCRPRRAQSISGTLTRLSEQSYRLSFSGDLSDTIELEPGK